MISKPNYAALIFLAINMWQESEHCPVEEKDLAALTVKAKEAVLTALADNTPIIPTTPAEHLAIAYASDILLESLFHGGFIKGDELQRMTLQYAIEAMTPEEAEAFEKSLAPSTDNIVPNP